MRYLSAFALLATLSLPAAAMADTITFGSFAGTTVTYSGAPPNTNPNGQPDTTPSSGTAVAYTGTTPYSVNNYVAPAGGTIYITYDNTSEYLPSGTTTYTLTFQGVAGAAGTLMFAADDSTTATLNGAVIGSAPGFSAFASVPVTLIDGTNTLSFDVTNGPQPTGAANPTALDFYGTAVTPEPSSMILLGTGLLSVAAMGRRKFMRA